MAIFKGFNTIGQHKKFSLNDYELVKRDLLNAFNIREGEVPGRPDVGTSIWNYVFEPLDSITVSQIKDEVFRITGNDPRLKVDSVEVSTLDNNVIVEISAFVLTSAEVASLFLTFNQEYNAVTIKS